MGVEMNDQVFLKIRLPISITDLCAILRAIESSHPTAHLRQVGEWMEISEVVKEPAPTNKE